MLWEGGKDVTDSSVFCDLLYQDLSSTAIYSVFLIIILDIYTTVSAFS